MNDKVLLDKEYVTKITMCVDDGGKANEHYKWVEKGNHDDRVKVYFKTFFGKEDWKWGIGDVAHDDGWYYNDWNNDTKFKSDSFKTDEEFLKFIGIKEHYIKDNILYTKPTLTLIIKHEGNNETHVYYFDTMKELNERMVVIQDNFKNLVVV